MKTRYVLLTVLGLLIVALAVACGGDDDDDIVSATDTPQEDAATNTPADSDGDDPTPEPTATSEPEPTEPSDEPGPDLPEATFSYPLRMAFTYGVNGFFPRELTDMPEYLQGVRAEWYKGGGRMIVVYRGLDLDASGPVCPGNSLNPSGTTSFDFISNSPTSEGACDTDPDIIYAPDDAGVRICDGVVSYITLIPDDAEGFLYATINAYPEGVDDWPGVTSNALLDRELQEIDPAILEC